MLLKVSLKIIRFRNHIEEKLKWRMFSVGIFDY